MSERYARHELIPGWSQDALRAATVVVFGVGALGNEVARLLAMAGAGRLVLCDPDTVAESNLSRCVLFRAADVGSSKVAAARAALASLAPDTEVDARPLPLHSGVGLAELRDATLVVGCLDSVAARVELASRCALAGVGWLDGGTGPWGGEVRRYEPGGACYGCLVGASGRAATDDPLGCGAWARPAAAGASAPVSALVGAWLATAAVRALCGLPTGAPITLLDVADGVSRGVEMVRTPDCPLHEPVPADAVTVVKAAHTGTVADVLAQVGPDEDVLAWNGFTVADPRRPRAAPIPGRPGRTRTVLNEAPPDAVLRDLHVAPREILPVVSRERPDAERYIELSAEAAEPER